MSFIWCLWECDPVCDLWWSQWMFDLRCRHLPGNHDPHSPRDSHDSWLLTRDASHARCPAPALCTPGLFSSPGPGSPLIMTAGERREERGVREGSPGTGRHLLMMASHTRSPAESLRTHSWYHDDHRCRALYWRIGFVQSAVRCSAAEWCAGCVALVMFTADVRVG